MVNEWVWLLCGCVRGMTGYVRVWKYYCKCLSSVVSILIILKVCVYVISFYGMYTVYSVHILAVCTCIYDIIICTFIDARCIYVYINFMSLFGNPM